MPPPSPLINRLLQNRPPTVITATRRLARELTRQYDHHQSQLGKRAWETPDILPYPAWLLRTWHDLHNTQSLLTAHPDLATPPLILTDPQLHAAWEEIIATDIHRHEKRTRKTNPSTPPTEPLWNPYATAKSAIAAWQILYNWDIALPPLENPRKATPAHSNQPDHESFIRWANKFKQTCREKNWLDAHRLPNRLHTLITRLTPTQQKSLATRLGDLTLIGFDHLLPQQKQLIATLRTAKIAITTPTQNPTPTPTPTPIQFRSHPNETQEWLSAATWARQQREHNPTATLAIIAPNLAQSAPAIDYALRQILSPPQLLAPTTHAHLPYHISLGKRLSHYPLAQAALLALSLLATPRLSAARLSQLLLSPFIQGAQTEATARAKFERWCRRHLTPPLDLAYLIKLLTPKTDAATPNRPTCPLLAQALQTALANDQTLAGKSQAQAQPQAKPNKTKKPQDPQPFHHWVQRFTEWLHHLNWHGECQLDSDEYQTAHAIREQITALAKLDLTAPPCTAQHALQWLTRRLDEQTFQVEAHARAPVQVLGIVEASGLQFDGIWFGGLVEADWPPPQRPNPFIPAAAQRRARVFAASLEAHYQHAIAQQNRLRASAPEIIFSYPRAQDELATRRSPLLDELPDAPTPPDCETNANANINANSNSNAEAIAQNEAARPADFIQAHHPPLEKFTDPCAPAFPDADTPKGGTSIFRDQAQCPFRAFATHRLGARDFEPSEQGLTPAERGSFLHRVLEIVWRELKTAQNLRALHNRPAQLQKLITTAAQTATAEHAATRNLGKRFQQTQLQWARATIGELLDLEAQRADFTVEAREEKIQVALYGINLTLLIDRIDRIATTTTSSPNNKSGGRAIIDYKSGNISLSDWRGERMQEPQLPLYALALAAHNPAKPANPPKTEQVNALGFAWIKRGKCGFSGVSHDDADATPFPPLSKHRSLKNDFADWNAMLKHWDASLSKLGAEFLAGEARVDPLPNACTYCDLGGLCRVQPTSGDYGDDATTQTSPPTNPKDET